VTLTTRISETGLVIDWRDYVTRYVSPS